MATGSGQRGEDRPLARPPPSAWTRSASPTRFEPHLCVTVLGMVAEMERRFIWERQQAGIEAAKTKGIYKGRKRSVPVEKVREMHEAGQGPTAIAKALGISRMTAWCTDRLVGAEELGGVGE